MVSLDAAGKPEFAPVTAISRKHNGLRDHLENVAKQMWAGIKKFHKAPGSVQKMDESHVTPPPYARVNAEVFEEETVRKFRKSAFATHKKGGIAKLAHIDDRKAIRDDDPVPGTTTGACSYSRERELARIASYRLLGQLARSKVDKVKLLRSVLVFIMFATFAADIDMLDTETDSVLPWHRSVIAWTDIDPKESFHWDIYHVAHGLGVLIRHLEEDVRLNRLSNIHRQRKDLLIQLVLKPAEQLMLQPDFVLELLGEFMQIRLNDNTWPYYTLFDYWKSQTVKGMPRTSNQMLDLGDMLASHVSFIVSLDLYEELQLELEDAIREYLETEELGELQMSATLKQTVLEELRYRPRSTCCWPLRESYMDLFRMFGAPDGTVWRRRIAFERAHRNIQTASRRSI